MSWGTGASGRGEADPAYGLFTGADRVPDQSTQIQADTAWKRENVIFSRDGSHLGLAPIRRETHAAWGNAEGRPVTGRVQKKIREGVEPEGTEDACGGRGHLGSRFPLEAWR